MLAAMEAENRIEFVDFDGLQCANVGETSDRLEQIECKLRVTAIVVATGKDEVNATIAMRLRLLQRERLILKAPIFVRSDARRSVAPEAIDHLNAGIIYFGGRTRSRMDMRMSALFDDIGRAVHESWVKGQIMRGENPSKWVNMSAAQRQSSVRAAMFLPEIYRVMGLVPDANAAQASMRISSPVAQHLLDTVAGFTALHRTEHDRWRSEKAADGYKLAVGAQRDDEKKLHPSLAAFDLLPIDEQNKDLDVLKTIIDNAPKLNKAFALWPQWRKRVRVSVMGPIRGASPYLSELPTILEKLVADQSLPIECLSLEVLTPDAPGFDTEAATALLDSWRRLSNRPGDLLRLRILTKARLDTEAIAAKNLRHDAVEEANAALSRAARGRDRMIDLRPLGASDVDILSTSKTFADGIETANAHIIDLADICIFGGADRPQSHSSRAAKTAATKKKTIVTIDASGVAKVSPARQES
ncbi:hypothetical protein ATO11_04330 [Pseudaestuariivita atlantica]|uniref:Uncharacterized protein n=2 Tax=Pseudaestuariivita atlantica TaxID=1317121 RepID=A0A0L1JSC0_9RHOB|nr:hypothetical protein ATO11_04330 [Pseudaestuariivita atlantica]